MLCEWGESVWKNPADGDRPTTKYGNYGALMADKIPGNNALGEYTVSIFPGKGGG